MQPNAIPIIKAAKSFVGLGVISVDVYTGENAVRTSGTSTR